MNILMVCLGNICRSPVAEGILKHKLEQNKLEAYVDSAGTSGWHDGEQPDERSMKNALFNENYDSWCLLLINVIQESIEKMVMKLKQIFLLKI